MSERSRGRWAVVYAVPGSVSDDDAWLIYASLNVARFRSKRQARGFTARRRDHGCVARIVRWSRLFYARPALDNNRWFDRHMRCLKLLNLPPANEL